MIPQTPANHEARLNKIAAAKDRRCKNRDLLRDRLESEGASDFAAMLEKCGNEIRLVCCQCGAKKIAESRCKKRWCPACAYYIAAERVAKYAAAAAQFKWPLFVTLTMRNTVTPEGLKTMKKAWGKLRRRKLIRDRVKSGIVGFEVTNKGAGWHPHCHALLDCEWLALHVPPPRRLESAPVKEAKARAAAEELSALWASILGQETASVRVRRGDSNALVEVLKYSVKGSDLIESSDRAADLIAVMQGMRLITTFGDIRKKIADEDPEQEDDETSGCTCEACGGRKTMIPQSVHDMALRQAFDRRNAR